MIYLLRLLAISLFQSRNVFRELAIENLALRQQLAVYHQKKRKPRISRSTRLFWVLLAKASQNWKDALVIVTSRGIAKDSSPSGAENPDVASRVGQESTPKSWP